MLRVLLVAFLLPLSLQGADSIDNGQRPAGKAKTLVFTEDLMFGADEDDDEYLWSDAETTLAVDDAGNIYVADTGDARILCFDASGKYVKTLAKEGPGPGELKSLASFHILADGTAVAQEALRMAIPRRHYFKTDLTFDKVVTPQGEYQFSTQVVVSPKGTHYAGMYMKFDMQKGKQVLRTALFDMGSQKLKDFSMIEQGMQMQRFREPGYLAEYMGESLKNIYTDSAIFNFDDQGRLYSALRTKYEISIWNGDMQTPQRIVRRDYKPVPNTPDQVRGVLDRIADRFRPFPGMDQVLTDSFLDRIVEETEVPPAANPVWGIIPMQKGGFLVVHQANSLSGEQTVDIFSEAGKFVGQSTLKDWAFVTKQGYPRMVFSRDYAYTVHTDEEGDNRVARYRVALQ